MKTLPLLTLLILATANSCNNTPSEGNSTPAKATTVQPSEEQESPAPQEAPGEACSITFSGITFTRSLNDAAANITLEAGTLTLKSGAERDNFNDPDGKLSNNTAPVHLTEIDNTQPFTFKAKMTPTFKDTYDAGTLYIYLDPDHWFKYAFELDERELTRIVTVRTIGTSDDNNHDVVSENSVYMKISSDTETVGFYYSLNQDTWQLVRLFKNDYPNKIWIGLGAQSPKGEGTEAVLEDATLTQTSIKDFRMGV